MLAIHDSYSTAILADTTSMETNLMTAKATRRRTKMLLTRMPMLESDSKVRLCTWLSEAISLIHYPKLELLCPLKHPSELPVHPTMSHPYLSTALPDMVK